MKFTVEALTTSYFAAIYKTRGIAAFDDKRAFWYKVSDEARNFGFQSINCRKERPHLISIKEVNESIGTILQLTAMG